MLTNLDFNRLKVFYFVYSHKSIVGAANQLSVTRSAVSQHLKKFESEVNTRLFTRLHKQLVPTAAAEQLFQIIDPFFHDLETGLKTIKQGKLEPSGMLRIGAPIEFGKSYLPQIIGRFREKYPQTMFTLTLGYPDKLITMVKQGDLDFAVVDLFITQSQYLGDLGVYSIEPLIDEEVILVCSKQYCEEVLNSDFSLTNLISREFVAYQSNTLVLKSWFKHHFRKTSVSLKVVLTVDSVQAVISAIENNVGLGVVPSHVVYDDIQAGKLVVVKTKSENIINRMSLVQLQDKYPNMAEKKFREYLKKVVSEERVQTRFSRIADAQQ